MKRTNKIKHLLSVLMMVLMLCETVSVISPQLTAQAEEEKELQLSRTLCRVPTKTQLLLDLVSKDGEVVTSGIKWRSSNHRIAQVNEFDGFQGLVTAKRAGMTIITAEYEGEKYTCKIFVDDPKLIVETNTMVKGQKQTLELRDTLLKVKWTSSNPSVASISSRGGVLTAKRAGTTKVTAIVSGIFYSTSIKVEVPTISETSMTLVKNQKKKITLNGTEQTPVWTSSNPSIASVSANGTITAIKAGNVTITAELGGQKYTCKLRVDAPSLSQTKLTLTVGESQTLRMRNTSLPVRWLINKKSIADVTNGTITAKKAGSAVITAVVGGQKYTCNLTVQSADQKVKDNYAKLLNAIQTKGSTDSKGFLALMNTDYEDGTRYCSELAYNPSNKKFVFKTQVESVIEDVRLLTETRLVFSGSDFKNVIVQVDTTFPDYGLGYSLKTSFKSASYDGKGNKKFTVVSKNPSDILDGTSEAEIQELGNVYLQYSFAEWGYLLKDTTGMSMKDLGFSAYTLPSYAKQLRMAAAKSL